MPSDYDRIRADNILEYGQGTRHLSFLGRLYTDRTHFIFELLVIPDIYTKDRNSLSAKGLREGAGIHPR